MGSWWRSEDMTYVSIILSEEAAPLCIRELGNLGCIQFTDLNPELTPFQRHYVSYIRRCDEIERKIRFLHGEVKKMEIPVQPAGSVNSFLQNPSNSDLPNASGASILESLESKLEVYEVQLIELNKYCSQLSQEFCHKAEYHQLLKKAKKLSAEAGNLERASLGESSEAGISLNPLLRSEEGGSFQNDEMSFTNIAGTVSNEDKVRFERMIFRTTRGNCFIRWIPLGANCKDAQGKLIDRIGFMIFFKSHAIDVKLKRICDAFSVNRYDMSEINNPRQIQAIESANYKEILDIKSILNKNTETRLKICLEISQFLEEYLWIVRREKNIYHSLNLFKNDVAGNLLRGRGWILTSSLNSARQLLKNALGNNTLGPTAMIEKVNNEVIPTPPTHFQTNKYTYAFQEFVNTYGMPRYKEANPALFTAATFPFLFGVMYGDIGHGSLLSMGGLYLILTEKNATARGIDEMVAGLYSARYMIFAMGLFAVYAGFVYNDYFSIGLNLMGTNYTFPDHTDGAQAVRLTSYGDPNGIYPFGVDPAWKISGNELLFYNSMKMKMSVILGIFQMTLGICLRGINAHYFKNKIDLITEFVPMIIFAMALFGYMVILIFIKWSINWDERMALGTCGYDINGTLGACSLDKSSFCYNAVGETCDRKSTLAEVCPLDYGGTGDGCQPPNLITTLINIALSPGYVEEPMFAGQSGLQTFLLIVAFLCVPFLLCAKPFYLRHLHQQEQANAGHGNSHESRSLLHDEEEGGSGEKKKRRRKKKEDEVAPAPAPAAHAGGHGHGHDGEFNFGEIFIHQAIETIEFVLGMVSNTASYLRLWALSLAHSELALVFWEKAMVTSISANNPVFIFFGFAVFAGVTFGVLLAMDVLECFLHALRLHWVEFQNKFFRADGYRFEPFSFHAILEKALLE